MRSAFPSLQMVPCEGVAPTQFYTAPGPVFLLAYNGVLLPRDNHTPGVLSYSTGGGGIALNFTTEPGDRIDAFCVV